MPRELILPSAVMTLALVSYSYGVWGERILRDLLPRHVVAFWLGFALDAVGTGSMFALARLGLSSGAIHAVFGDAAFALMLLHALWASWVLARGSRAARQRFHRYSLVVWLIWLVPYLGGMVAGMMRGLGL